MVPAGAGLRFSFNPLTVKSTVLGALDKDDVGVFVKKSTTGPTAYLIAGDVRTLEQGQIARAEGLDVYEFSSSVAKKYLPPDMRTIIPRGQGPGKTPSTGGADAMSFSLCFNEVNGSVDNTEISHDEEMGPAMRVIGAWMVGRQFKTGEVGREIGGFYGEGYTRDAIRATNSTWLTDLSSTRSCSRASPWTSSRRHGKPTRRCTPRHPNGR